MTAERLLIFDVADLRGIRVECKKCQAQITIRLDQTPGIKAVCPSCNAEWFGGQGAHDAALGLTNAIKLWLKYEREKKPDATLRLEFSDPTRQ
jgi:hypothetical protein